MATNAQRSRKPAHAAVSGRSTTDELADQLASKLSIRPTSKAVPKRTTPKTTSTTTPTTKGVPEATTSTPKDTKAAAMRTVNASLQSLTALVKSGWKRSSSSGKAKVDDGGVLAKMCSEQLAVLRDLGAGIDVERAALSVAGKLIQLELYDEVKEVLTAMYGPFVNALELPTSSTWAAIPLGSSNHSNMVSSYLAYAITAHCFTSDVEETSSLLNAGLGTFLDWMDLFENIDGLLTRVYSALTKSTASSKSSPVSILILRMYAMRCLVMTSGAVVEAGQFWDSVGRFVGSYARNSQDTEPILRHLDGLVSLVQTQKPGWMGSDRFLALCELWIGVGKKAGDIEVLQKIARLMQNDLTDAFKGLTLVEPKTPLPVKAQDQQTALTLKELLVHGTKMCAVFAQGCVALESTKDTQSARDSLQACVQVMRTSPALFWILRAELPDGSKDPGDEFIRVSGKIDRALERLRRGAAGVLESGSGSMKEVGVDVLSSCVVVLTGLLKSDTESEQPRRDPQKTQDFMVDVLSRLLNSLFLLARTTLVVLDPQTYIPAYDLLESGVKISEGVLKDQEEFGLDVDIPNYLRCISGAYYNLAGQLYQTGRYGATVPFLKRACGEGERGLKMRKDNVQSGSPQMAKQSAAARKEKEEKDEKEWTLLEQQLFKRYELLAVCYLKNGDRRNSFGAFKECVRVFPFETINIQERSDRAGVTGVFNLDATFGIAGGVNDGSREADAQNPEEEKVLIRQLVNLLDRVTYVGACELLLEPEEVTLLSTFVSSALSSSCSARTPPTSGRTPGSAPTALTALATPDPRAAGFHDQRLVGVILEYQYDSLLANRRKEGARQVLIGLLKDALEVYSTKAVVAKPDFGAAPLALQPNAKPKSKSGSSATTTRRKKVVRPDTEAKGDVMGYLMPIRRARVLLKSLEFIYHDGDANSGESEQRGKGNGKPAAGDQGDLLRMLGFGGIQEVREEILKLLDCEHANHDRHLVQFNPQYRISTHLWMALHDQRLGVPDALTRVGVHVEKAARCLRELLDSSNPSERRASLVFGVGAKANAKTTPIRKKVPASPKVVKPRGGAGTGTVSGSTKPTVVVRRIVSPRVTRSVRAPAAVPLAPQKPAAGRTTRTTRPRGGAPSVADKTKPPVTPKVGARAALQPLPEKSSPRVSIDKSALAGTAGMPFDNFESFHDLLMLTVRILGLLSLLLPRVRLLASLRRLCQRQLGASSEAFIVCSLELAYEYVQLGKLKRAKTIFGTALDVVRAGETSAEISTFYLLRFSEALALAGDVEKSSKVYLEAFEHVSRIEPDHRGMTSVQRIHSRTRKLELSAMAAYVNALVQSAREDMTTSLNAMLQSLRLWNRAIDAISRISKTSNKASNLSDSNPFESSSAPSPAEASTSTTPIDPRTSAKAKSILQSGRGRGAGGEFEWRIFQGLLSCMFNLSNAYATRGSPREAEYFLVQAKELAGELNLDVAVGRALTRMSEIQLGLGRIENAQESLGEAAEILGIKGYTIGGGTGENIVVEGDSSSDYVSEDGGREGIVATLETIENKRLLARFNERSELNDDAQELLFTSVKLLEELNGDFQKLDSSLLGFRRSLDNEGSGDVVVPELLASVLCRCIWLLRENMDAEFHALVDKLEALPMSARTKVEEISLMANLTLHNVYSRFRGDMSLSSFTESTIAIPMGMSNNGGMHVALPVQDVLSALDCSEKYFQEGLRLTASSGDALKTREAAISLTLVKVFQTTLGRLGDQNAVYASSLLDASSAITLRREMLEAIQQKIASLRPDDLEWLMMDVKGAPRTQTFSRLSAQRGRPNDQDSETDEESDEDGEAMTKKYWESVRRRYEPSAMDPSSLSVRQTTNLPSNWTVIHVNLTEDKSALLVSRQECGEGAVEPLIFCVPLKGRRDNGVAEEEEHLTFEDAMKEFNEIIRLSDEGTKGAIHVRSDDEEARSKWWKQRNQLDVRLKDLLENIEFCWLGAFKTILSPRPELTPELLEDLRAGIDRVFQRSLYIKDSKRASKSRQTSHKRGYSQSLAPSQVSLDDTMLLCFSTLSPKCRDEELEDLLYFVLDLYQLHGVPIAIAEVDALQVVIDLRAALEEHTARLTKHLKAKRTQTQASADEHVFLVLDKNVQGLPWESLPIMKGRSVSRIPSIDFLVDRVELAQMRTNKRGRSTSNDYKAGSAVIDPRKGYFILNPSGDLGKTEARFKEWADDMKEVGWEGVVGRPLSDQQFADALKTRDIVVYFGHGGGEQYIRSHKIRSLPTCAATMLWGCSSGALREMGVYDRTGTPHNYMLAGCPTLIANLWDVTDRDIDIFSMSVFDKIGLNAKEIGQSTTQRQPVSVVTAVARSRDVCKLKYLTGAAPVVYGIPFYL